MTFTIRGVLSEFNPYGPQWFSLAFDSLGGHHAPNVLGQLIKGWNTMSDRKSSKMDRLRSGDVFNDGDDMLQVIGWPQRKTDNRVQIPVVRVGFGGVRAKKPIGRNSRRTFAADQRVSLV